MRWMIRTAEMSRLAQTMSVVSCGLGLRNAGAAVTRAPKTSKGGDQVDLVDSM